MEREGEWVDRMSEWVDRLVEWVDRVGGEGGLRAG